MDTLGITALEKGLSSVTRELRPDPLQDTEKTDGAGFGATFRDLLGGALEQSETKQADAMKISESFAKGESHDIHSVMTALNEADVSFRLVLEVRNKLVDAWQEIKRMPI